MESDEATLQPNVLVEENQKPDGVKKWVDLIRQMKDRVNGIKHAVDKTNEDPKPEKTPEKITLPTVFIHLPGSTKQIKVVASK